jgi:tripartite-type tricarboxylate transporter receptor subunit TctC
MTRPTFIDRRRAVVALAATAAGSLGLHTAASRAQGQDYRGPVKIVVGFPPGGANDVVARLLSDKLKDALGGQPVIIENKPGAGGMIATQQLKASPPDGSTIMLTIDHSHVIIPLTFKNPGYDPIKDFTPIAGISNAYTAMAVAGPLKIQTMKEYADWLKANPAQGNYGIPALGSVPQFAGLAVGKALGMQMVPVPYKGGAPLVQDLLAGQIPVGISALSEYIEHHRAGKLRVLAISGTKRSGLAPDVPTFQELGLKGLDKNPWVAFVGPLGMSPVFVDRFGTALETVLKQPDVADRLSKLGNEPNFARGPQLAEWIASSTSHWGPVIRESGFELQ